MQRIATYEWNIADTRANAPDNFPYSAENFSNESPTRNFEKAAELQKQGKTDEAVKILQTGKERFPFLKCETATNLAVIYYTNNQKETALQELESIQPLVNNNRARSVCVRNFCSVRFTGSLTERMTQTKHFRISSTTRKTQPMPKFKIIAAS